MWRTLSTAVFALGRILSPAIWAQGNPADDRVDQARGQKVGMRAVMEDLFVRPQAMARTGPLFKNADRERLVTQLTEQQVGPAPREPKQAPAACIRTGATDVWHRCTTNRRTVCIM